MFGRPGGLCLDHLKVERDSDPAGDLVLYGEKIARVAVEALRPQMCVGLCINQLRVDADLVAGTTNASFENIPHAQLAADLLGIAGLCR